MGRSKIGRTRLAQRRAAADQQNQAQQLLNAVNLRAAAIQASQQAQHPQQMVPHQPPSAQAAHSGPTQTLSNFVYYKKNGGTVNVDIRMGSVLTEHCDAIAFTVNESLSLHTPLPKKVVAKAGPGIKKDLAILKKSHHFTSGEVAAINLTSANTNGWKAVMGVVSPFEPTLTNAYTNILRETADRGLESVAIIGLGCGQLGISAKTSATSLMEALTTFDGESLKSVAILDIQLPVIEGFISRLRDIVREHSYKTEDREKLVFVSGDVLLEYEARRLTKTVSQEAISEDECVVCLCPLRDEQEQSEVIALKCVHQFHFDCFKGYLNGCQTRKCCPVCRKYFSMPCGNQPHGSTMSVSRLKNLRLEGHESSRHSICIDYNIPGGVQDESHLRPGVPFRGTRRVAFLPDSEEGRMILRLLKKAFECRLIFTVGDSVTTGAKNVVTWNSIHHKTSPDGGPQRFGYPDDTYLVRVRAELEEAGITEDLLSDEDVELNIPDIF